MSTQSPADLRPAKRQSIKNDVQKSPIEIYEDAALRAEANPARAEMAYAQAEAEAAPLIARARALNEERVRRLRLRARRWHTAAITVALAGTAAVAVWLGFRG
jgi:hypothetical protein